MIPNEINHDSLTKKNSSINSNTPDHCSLCNKPLSQILKEHNNLITLECQHSFCKHCLKKFVKEQFEVKKNYTIRCPICQYPLREKEIDAINPKYNKKLEQRFIRSESQDNLIITCPNCHEGFFFKAGDYAGITIDSNGEKIRPEALECLRKYRASCVKCETVFCVKCGCVPFHEGLTCEEEKLVKENVVCRFCRKLPPVGGRLRDVCHRVCWRKECKEHAHEACMHLCKCGHPCCGLRDEKKHFGCALCNAEISNCSFCGMCCTESPSVIMKCGHPAHKKCLLSYYSTFKFEGRIQIPRCPHNQSCGQIPLHECVKEAAEKWIDVSNKIEQLTLEKMKDEETENEKLHVNNPDDKEYYKNPLHFAHDFFVFYFCDKCHQPYYGGHKDCERDFEEEEEEEEHIDDNDGNMKYLCLRCQRKVTDTDCKKHGHDAMVYKCFFCCNPASHFCWGRVYFCDECHKNPYKAEKPPYPKCDGKCQFAPHPENGKRVVTGYCLECELEHEKKTIKT